MSKPHSITRIFLVIALFIPELLVAQTTVLSGQIVNASTARPLPFATLYSEELLHGTTCDMDGRFRIEFSKPVKTLTFSCIGFEKQKIEIITSISDRLIVKLNESPIRLKEVEIKSEDSIALHVIRQAVRMKSTNDPAALKSYRYKSYNKLYSTLNRFDLDSVKGRKDTVAVSNFLQRNHLFISESLTLRLHNSPGYDKEIVLANRFSGFKDPMFTILSSTFQPFSFYKNTVQVLDMEYISPLADNSWNQYHFMLENTIRTNSGDSLFVISFWPKHHNQLNCLTGTITISSEKFGIANIQTTTSDSKSLLALTLSQKYARHGDVTFPEQLNSEVKFNNVHVHGANVIFVYKGYFKNVEINPVLGKEHFDDVYLEFDIEANSRSEKFWNDIRTDTASQKDLNTYRFYDSLPKGALSALQNIQWLTQTVALKCIPLKYFNVQIDRLFLFNQYEGTRPGIGFSTSPRLSKYVKVFGYAGYGVRDRALKFDGGLSFLIHKRTSSQLSITYSQDIAEGASPFINDNIVTGSRFGVRDWIVSRMDSVTKIRMEYSMKPLPFFWVALNITNQAINPTYNYSFVNPEGESRSAFNVTATEVKLYYAKGQTKIQVGPGTMYTRPTFPLAELKISKAIENLAGSEYGFTKVHLNFLHSVQVRGLGRFSINVAGGFIRGTAPYPFIFNSNGTASQLPVSKLYMPNSFQLIGVNEFLSDQYVAMFASQSLGLLWNTKHSRPEVNLTQAITYGRLTHPERHHEITFNTLEKGYFESGLVINNVFRLNYANMFYLGFGAGVFYRHSSQFPNPSDNFGAKATISYTF